MDLPVNKRFIPISKISCSSPSPLLNQMKNVKIENPTKQLQHNYYTERRAVAEIHESCRRETKEI